MTKEQFALLEIIGEAIVRTQTLLKTKEAKGLFSNDYVMCVGKARLAFEQLAIDLDGKVSK
ncbi:MAG: hypothetical protein M3O22_04970 [Pseudomonadota bacterium]|nr:hypothetical protein [Pseudomonadota bacterium]